jgi:hypothetical protein
MSACTAFPALEMVLASEGGAVRVGAILRVQGVQKLKCCLACLACRYGPMR